VSHATGDEAKSAAGRSSTIRNFQFGLGDVSKAARRNGALCLEAITEVQPKLTYH
jgi:hypothetical protein